MNDMPQLSKDFTETRRELSQARHALPKIYSDPEIYKQEKDRIFMREWLFVAREEEVEKPGDYMTLRIFDEPLLLSRDKEGVLRAFANVCAHRGVEVAEGSGKADFFKCPYHGWTYKLDGKLLGAPLMVDNSTFDRPNCQLPPIHLGNWGGNIFVNFSKDPQPFEDFIKPYREQWDYLGHDRCRMAVKIPVELNCNWKFAVENLLDIYHVKVLHAGTFGAKFNASKENIKLDPGGVVSYYYKSAPATPDGISLFGRMPWISDRGDDLGCTFRMPPNTHMFARIDGIRYLVIWPTSVDTCKLYCYHIYPSEHFSLPDFAERAKVYADFQITVLEEDRGMRVSLQKAMSSRNYLPGPMAGVEATIHHVINDYLERMGFE